MSLERALSLSLVLAPYVALLEDKWPEFRRILNETGGARPALLSSLFRTLAGEMKESPGEMTRAVSILIDRTPEWMAERNVTAAEVVQALPVLDKINDFSGLISATKAMGLTVKYQGVE